MICPEGMIERIGYKAVRGENKKVYHVKPTCIPDVGKPGKTPSSEKIISSDELDLSIYGYKDLSKMNAVDRRNALQQAINDIESTESKTKHQAAVKVMRRLNYLYVLTRNSQVSLSKKLETDRNWIGRKYLDKNYKA
jgi:hypothetical protein